MQLTLPTRLLERERGEGSRHSTVRTIYGDRTWVDNLDIVNELGGHSGCVNALSWSRSGRLLASGSDDKHLNIYTYQPDSSTTPFSLNTTVSTGHDANIFSVKFMPHSNDQTLVTCAGDSQVRIFDLEYSARSAQDTTSPAHSALPRNREFYNFFNGVRYLSDRNTNARVFRSHADRVKRIVTESSPFLFLTCSEDGEVRQWDLRQPSSAYPAPRGGQGYMSYRPDHHDASNVPPPLISYKRYSLDLNSISCAASQPHYIAMGGAHLHCFLHDRRMLGRDRLMERGQSSSLPPSPGSHEDELMGQATRCVRRFAPGGKKRMKKSDNGHITACKISEAHPNEMVVSWSGEHIYSFDLVHSLDARDGEEKEGGVRKGTHTGRVKRSRNRKRKRENVGSSASPTSGGRHGSHLRSEDGSENGDMSFRVRYGNGESEDIPLSSFTQRLDGPENAVERARESVLNEAQKLSFRIAKGLVKLRKLLFSPETTPHQAEEARANSDPTVHTASYTTALGYSATYLPEMDEIIRTWRYPLNPTREDVFFQQGLRRNRESARRFVQAAGTLSRVLGGRLQTASGSDGPQLDLFRQIVPAPTEGGVIDGPSQFGYDFLKAILLWLEGGTQALVDGFKRNPSHRHDSGRFPLSETATEEDIEHTLIPYLQSLSGQEPVVNLEASRFEHDQYRILFSSQYEAVTAFGRVIKLQVRDGPAPSVSIASEGEGRPGPESATTISRETAYKFWGLKVGNSILMSAATGVDFQLVSRAFGGLRTMVEENSDEDVERVQEEIDGDEEEEQVEEVRLIRRAASGDREGGSLAIRNSEGSNRASVDIESAPDRDPELTSTASILREHMGSDDDDDDEWNEDDSEGDDDDDVESDDSDSDESGSGRLFIRRGGFNTNVRRENVEMHVPCSSHTNVYRGHCNVKTVKDVNYFGLDDEYVVSGSDAGHVFIWDRKTTDLVNILEGDSDVVNVVQGHPYEPTIAVSGIDKTIKIFSPDARAQNDARLGINIADPDAAANTSAQEHRNTEPREDLGLKSCKRMNESYQIMSQNDVERQGGMSEAYITRSMLTRLARALRERHPDGEAGEDGGGGGDGDGDGDDDGGGRAVVLDENCPIM
ncbi:hypothetical protein FQN54_008254 [Arachnomyces sp. PD_36]|nr:hypothetical protein FQN54_008254 [Arachnomyces sp. PD_36]